MSSIFGALNLNDADRVFSATVGQNILYQAVQQYLNRVNAEMDRALSVFVARTTEDYKLRYKLPGSGKLQKRREQSQFGARKTIGQWDVAFPLEDYGDQIAADDVTMAYMTVRELELHIQGIVVRDVNTVRFEVLKRLFNDTAIAFVDPLWGSLTVEPLADGDSDVVYPPVIGSETEATDDHYLESGYAASAITDANNPYVTLVAELEEHFGKMSGGPNIVTFINSAETPETQALIDFVEYSDRFIAPGTQTATVVGAPLEMPGRVIGRTNGTWVSEWDWIPSGYILAVSRETEAPLIQRVDPADTGLGRGLQLVARDEIFPFEMSFWRHRFGFGTGNRLAAAVMELGTGGTYTIPTIYA